MWRDPRPPVPPNGRHTPEPPMGGTEERLIGYGLATTGAAGALVWASGQLAGLAFGHTWMHLSPADVASVLWHLPHTWSDPALAWPADVRAALPGPVGMYASAGTVVGGVAGGTAATVRAVTQYLPGRAPGHRPGREHTRRHRQGSVWAGGRELRLLFVRRPTPGRVIVGRTSRLAGLARGGRLLASEDCHSVLVFGPTGSLNCPGFDGGLNRWVFTRPPWTVGAHGSSGLRVLQVGCGRARRAGDAGSTTAPTPGWPARPGWLLATARGGRSARPCTAR